MRALVAQLVVIGLAPTGVTLRADDVTPPPPAPVRTPIVGFADTHVHQFSNLGFGGVEVWGSPVDPTFDPAAFLAAPDAARGRALPDSDYIYLSTIDAMDYLAPVDLPAIATPLASSCDDGSCWAQCPAGTGVAGNPCWRITVHGDNGSADLLNQLIAGPTEHGTMGFPDMQGWPAFDVVTAQQVYWEWLKRAHDHGMKLMVMLAVNNSVLCRLGLRKASLGCDDDGAVARQIQGAKNLEQYIDAVEGGPGQGFYKIVYSAAQAREAIDAGKLAVVLGAEVDTPWGCTTGGSCSAEHIEDQVQSYHDAGIRVVYPVHLIDNAFGGTALYNGLFELNNLLVNGSFYSITDSCDPGLEWRSDIRKEIQSAQNTIRDWVIALLVAGPLLPLVLPIALPIISAAIPILVAAVPAISMFVPILGLLYPDVAVLASILAPFLPIAALPLVAALAILVLNAPGEVGAPPAANCNARGLTAAGETLINELMDRRMIIDTDHTDTPTFDAIMDIAEDRKYPGMVAGHTGLLGAGMTQAEAAAFGGLPLGESGRHEGVKTDAQVARITALGGVVSLGLAQGGRNKVRDFDGTDLVPFDCGGSSQSFAQVYLYATRQLGLQSVSFGSDLNGFSTWPTPRFGPRACGDRPGHPGDFPAGYSTVPGGINYNGLTDYFGVSLAKYSWGSRTWDYNTDGFAHVGLYPDFIADLEATGLSRAELAPLFNGVEAYVRMWEKVDDAAAPTVRCGTVGENWHAGDVTVPCIAFDTGWDLENPADASFSLTTAVADGTETGDAATGTHAPICDGGDNCTGTIPAITGINVDKKDPTITLTTPPSGTPTYIVNQEVAADYSCADGGSGVATCAGNVADAANIDTSPGVHTFTVNAADNVNHQASVSHPYTVAFAICPLYDASITKKAGSTVPIKLQLCDVNGVNLSQASIVVHAVGVTRTGDSTPAALEDAGNANPDLDFRYDAALGGYIFNLSTRGFSAGTYTLNFTAAPDPTVHTATFAVR